VRDAGPDRLHLRTEQLLDRPSDIDLRGVECHFEHDDRRELPRDRGLLRNQRPTDDFGELSHPSTSCNRSMAACVAMMRRVFITSRAVRRPLGTTLTPARLRAER